MRRSISIISSFSIDDMSLVAPEVKQLSIRSQSKALASMRYQPSIFYSTLNQGKRGKGRQNKRKKERKERKQRKEKKEGRKKKNAERTQKKGEDEERSKKQ